MKKIVLSQAHLDKRKQRKRFVLRDDIFCTKVQDVRFHTLFVNNRSNLFHHIIVRTLVDCVIAFDFFVFVFHHITEECFTIVAGFVKAVRNEPNRFAAEWSSKVVEKTKCKDFVVVFVLCL